MTPWLFADKPSWNILAVQFVGMRQWNKMKVEIIPSLNCNFHVSLFLV